MQIIFEFVKDLLAKIKVTNPNSFWLMVQSLVILITLFYVQRQVRVNRYGNMLQTLNNMRENWNNKQMMGFRRTTCENYLEGTKKIEMAEGEVLGFFEEMGLLLQKKVVSQEFIWETYSYYIEHYWSMLKDNIQEFRLSTQDKSWYDHFEYLRDSVRRYSERKNCPSIDKTKEEIKRFISSELET